MVEISTSILSVKKEDIIKTIYNLETAHTDYFHIDVMDGKFVENNNSQLMLEYAEYIKQISNIPLDVHLMVEDVYSYVNTYFSLKPNIITFHIEAIEDEEKLKNMIKYIKENGIRVGIAIKPNTKIEKLYKILPFIHLVLVMTVEPGKGGQELIDITLEKISELKSYIDKEKLDVDIEADGGIKLSNISKVKEVGTNIIVSGTGIINEKDYKDVIEKMKR